MSDFITTNDVVDEHDFSYMDVAPNFSEQDLVSPAGEEAEIEKSPEREESSAAAAAAAVAAAEKGEPSASDAAEVEHQEEKGAEKELDKGAEQEQEKGEEQEPEKEDFPVTQSPEKAIANGREEELERREFIQSISVIPSRANKTIPYQRPKKARTQKKPKEVSEEVAAFNREIKAIAARSFEKLLNDL